MMVAMVAMIVGKADASADTNVIQDGVGGWTKITALPSALGDYYFVFVDNSEDLMLSLMRGKNQGSAYNTVYYKTSANPLVDKSMLWTLEANGDCIVITNAEYSTLFLQTEYNAAWNYRTHDNGGGNKSWGNVKAALVNGRWTLQNGKYPDSGYLGPWSNTIETGAELAANKSGNSIGYFQIYAIAKSDAQAYWDGLQNGTGASATNPLNMTGLICNPNACYWTGSIPYGWTTTGTQNVNTGNGFDGTPCFFEFSNWNANSWTGSIKQTLSVPNGKYMLKAALQASNGVTAYLTANNDQSDNLYAIGASGGSILADGTETSLGNGVAGWQYLTVETIVTNGSLEMGAYAEASGPQLWVNADNFTLWYYGPLVSNAAEALPSEALEVGKWYYFDIPTDGDYTMAAGSSLSDIVYTTNGSQLAETATGSTWNEGAQTLSAGRYYVKSASSQTLSVTATSYSYMVGSATANVQYVQGGEMVTVTFANVATNNPDAKFEMQATPNITFGEANSSASAQTVTATENGFTFSIPSSLSTATDYELNIPAGAFGFAAGDTYNEAQTLLFHTPALLDGTYFFSNENGRFWMRGEPYGSAVQLYDWGLPVNVTTDGSGVSILKFADASDWFIFSDGTGIYADNVNPTDKSWNITFGNGKYTFQNVENEKYMKVDGDRVLSTAAQSEATAFNCVSVADHRTVFTGLVNSQASAAATAASLTAATPAELESAIETAGWVGLDIVEGDIPTTTAEKFQGGQWDSRVVYSGNVSITTPGLYKFTMQGFYRMTENATTYPLHAAGADCPPAYVFFGDAKTPIASVFDASNSTANGCYTGADGKYYPNNQSAALTAFQAGHYTNTVWAYISEAGEYTYGIQYLGWAGSHAEWCCYTKESVSVTLYSGSGILVSDGIVTVLGSASVADINEALTADISVLDLEHASGLVNADISTTNNPNLLIYTASARQVSNHNNVIVSGSCSNLNLVKCNTAFIVPKAFTAISATYEVKSADLAGGQFATLMIPFTASGTAFVLDQDIAFSDATVKGTSVTTIPQNKPVLVKAAQTLTASNAFIPVIAKNEMFTNGKLTGVYSPTTAPVNSYVLQNHTNGGGVAFYRVNGVQPTAYPFRAYLNASTNEAKAIFVEFDGATSILEKERDGMGVEAVYSVEGIRLENMQKGVNMVKMKDGSVRKIIIK